MSDTALLALDVGKRTTGVAFGRPEEGIALSLDTISHSSSAELISKVEILVSERQITHLIIGLPLLPSGDEGSEVRSVKRLASSLEKLAPVTFIDERYTNLRHATDDHAEAARLLLEIALKRSF